MARTLIRLLQCCEADGSVRVILLAVTHDPKCFLETDIEVRQFSTVL